MPKGKASSDRPLWPRRQPPAITEDHAHCKPKLIPSNRSDISSNFKTLVPTSEGFKSPDTLEEQLPCFRELLPAANRRIFLSASSFQILSCKRSSWQHYCPSTDVYHSPGQQSQPPTVNSRRLSLEPPSCSSEYNSATTLLKVTASCEALHVFIWWPPNIQISPNVEFLDPARPTQWLSILKTTKSGVSCNLKCHPRSDVRPSSGRFS